MAGMTQGVALLIEAWTWGPGVSSLQAASMKPRYGCFDKFGGLFCGCPCNKSPTAWGPY